jgi:hypothetical protein
MKARRISLYRNDSTTPVVIEPVKHLWYENDGKVLVLAVYADVVTGAHFYLHWPLNRLTWFKDERIEV